MENFWKLFFLLLIGTMFNMSTAKNDDHEQPAVCTPKVQLTVCNTKFNRTSYSWLWRRDVRYTIHSIVNRGCYDSTLEFQWSLQDETTKSTKRYPPGKNKWSFSIEYFELRFGNYILELKVKESRKGSKPGTDSAKCLITIVSQLPLSRIYGGTNRMVGSEKSFKVDGTLSTHSKDERPGAAIKMHYRWFCTSIQKSDFCNSTKPISEDKEVTIPASKAIDGYQYEFELKVSSDKTHWDSSKQIVRIKKGAVDIYIACVKNCGRSLNHHSVLFLQMRCDNCQKDKIKWSWDPDKYWLKPIYGDESVNLVFKRNGFYNNSEEPEENKIPVWTATVKYAGGIGEAALRINGGYIPDMKCAFANDTNASTWKFESYGFNTTYHGECFWVDKKQVFTRPLTYKMYTAGYVSTHLVAVSEDGIFQNVRLAYAGPINPANNKPKRHLFRAIDADGFYFEFIYTLRVLSSIMKADLDPPGNMRLFMATYEGELPFGSVKSVFESGDYERALQMLYALTIEIQYITKDKIDNITTTTGKFRSKWQWTVLEYIKKIPIDSLDRLNQVTTVLYVAEYVIKDRVFRIQATDMLKRILKKYRKLLQNSPYPENLDSDVEMQTKRSLVFALTCTRPSPENLQHEKFGYNNFNFTTPKYFLDFPVVKEDYPNYDDADLQYAMKLRDYQDLCDTTMELFRLTSLLILHLMVPGEFVREGVKVIDDATFFPENFTRSYVLICLDDVKVCPLEEFGAFSTFINATTSVRRWQGLIAVVVVAFDDRKAFLWWQDKYLSAPVLNVMFFKNNKRKETLPEPMKLKFTNVTDPTMNFTATDASVTVPLDSDKWISEYLDYNMTVHRLRIKRGGMLNVRFENISTTNEEAGVQVAVTYNRRPHWTDFNEAILVKNEKNNKSIRSIFPNVLLKYGDTFAYVAVLPTGETTKTGAEGVLTVKYKVRFVQINCLLWNPLSLKWINEYCSTNLGTRDKVVDCQCTHLSGFSSLIEPAPGKIDYIFSLIPFTLSMQSNDGIYVCIYCIFAIYCIALALGTNIIKKQHSKKNKVLFLSDNVQSERYAYLVAIKTGNKDDAGTTSNVGMKIFGNKRDSMAHLLNYPDPSKNLLQRDEEDWFVLTADKHLGIVQRIHVWHDSVGQRPSWYCDWLTITDLQTLDEWYFNVKTWLSVTREEKCKLILEPSDPDAKKKRYKKKFFERIKKQHTWNICSKEGLSYLEHITVMLSIVLTTYAFTLMFYPIPKFQLYDGLGHGHFEITKTTLYITIASSILSFGLNTAFVVLLKMSKDSKSIRYRMIRTLTWILMAFTILACLTFLVICSFWIPIVTTLLWLFSTSAAIIIIIFLLENAYLVFTALLNKIVKIKAPSVTRVALVEEIERQREKLYSTFGEVLFRPYFKDKYRPLTREDWKMKKQQELARLKIADLMKDLIVFVIYIVLLYYVTLANKDAYDVYGNKEMKNIVYGLHTRTINFKDIQNHHDFETYVNQTLIPNLFALHWYGNSNLKNPGLLSDFSTKIINVARYRQLRVCKRCCKVPDVMAGLNLTCAPEFSRLYNDKGVYQEFWKDKKREVVPRLIDAWKYQYDAISFVGEVAVYPSGGYITPLGRTVYNTFYDRRYYQNAHWIDKRTSVIFIEFLAYDRNYNLFHAITLMVEHSVSGLFINTAKINTARLLYLDYKLQTTVTYVFLLFVVITFVMFLRNLNAARKSLITYFKNAWNILDIVIILMSFSYIVLYLHRATVIGQLLQRLQKKHNEMISYFDIISADEMFKVVAAILVFVATVRLCKLLTFGMKFKIMELMARLMDKHLFTVFIFHIIVLLAYSLIGNLLFGSYFKEFRNISVSMTTMILLSLNLASKFDYERFATFGYTFYVSYMLVTVIIFALYITVIILAYDESSGFYSNRRQYYSFTRYIFDEFHYIKGLVMKGINYVRLSAGADDKTTRKKVTPKENKYRYGSAVTLSKEKLHTMNLIALSVIKNYLKEKKEEETISEEEITLMTQTVYNILKPEEEEDTPKHDFVAFATNDKDGKRVLVKDETLLKMEYIANYLADKTAAMHSKAVSLEGAEQRVFDKTTIQGRLEYLEHILQGLSDLFDNIKVVYE